MNGVSPFLWFGAEDADEIGNTKHLEFSFLFKRTIFWGKPTEWSHFRNWFVPFTVQLSSVAGMRNPPASAATFQPPTSSVGFMSVSASLCSGDKAPSKFVKLVIGAIQWARWVRLKNFLKKDPKPAVSQREYKTYQLLLTRPPLSIKGVLSLWKVEFLFTAADCVPIVLASECMFRFFPCSSCDKTPPQGLSPAPYWASDLHFLAVSPHLTSCDTAHHQLSLPMRPFENGGRSKWKSTSFCVTVVSSKTWIQRKNDLKHISGILSLK